MLSFEFLLQFSAILKRDFLKSPGKSDSARSPRGMKLGNFNKLLFFSTIISGLWLLVTLRRVVDYFK